MKIFKTINIFNFFVALNISCCLFIENSLSNEKESCVKELMSSKSVSYALGMLVKTSNNGQIFRLGKVHKGHKRIFDKIEKFGSTTIEKILWAGELAIDHSNQKVILINETAGIIHRRLNLAKSSSISNLKNFLKDNKASHHLNFDEAIFQEYNSRSPYLHPSLSKLSKFRHDYLNIIQLIMTFEDFLHTHKENLKPVIKRWPKVNLEDIDPTLLELTIAAIKNLKRLNNFLATENLQRLYGEKGLTIYRGFIEVFNPGDSLDFIYTSEYALFSRMLIDEIDRLDSYISEEYGHLEFLDQVLIEIN